MLEYVVDDNVLCWMITTHKWIPNNIAYVKSSSHQVDFIMKLFLLFHSIPNRIQIQHDFFTHGSRADIDRVLCLPVKFYKTVSSRLITILLLVKINFKGRNTFKEPRQSLERVF